MGTDWLSRLGISLEDFKAQVFRKLGKNEDPFTDDVCAEILLRLTRILSAEPEKFASPDALYRYVRKVAPREAWHQKERALRQRPTDPVLFADLASPAPANADGPTKEDFLQWLNDPVQRDILQLHLEGLQGKAIAKILGLPPSKVSKLLTKAKIKLRTRYANERRTS